MNWLTVRHPARAGVLCLLTAFAVVLAALGVPKLILAGKTEEYHAVVANATGLQPEDPVNVAGVASGVVSSMTVRSLARAWSNCLFPGVGSECSTPIGAIIRL